MFCSRSILGVIIGTLNVLVYVGLVIYSIFSLVQLNRIDAKDLDLQQQKLISFSRTISIILLILSTIMIVISGLLVMGIVKKRYKLMIPWMLLSTISFIYHCGNMVFTFFGALFSGAAMYIVFTILFVSILTTVIWGLILWLIFLVYQDIRKGTTEVNGRVLSGGNIEYQNNHKI